MTPMMLSEEVFDVRKGRAAATVVAVHGNGGTLTKYTLNSAGSVTSSTHGQASVSEPIDGHATYYDFGEKFLIDWWYGSTLFRVEAESRPGYKLLGFSKTPTGPLLVDRDATAFEAPATFYARWQKVVSAFANGGTLTKYTLNGEGSVTSSNKGLSSVLEPINGQATYYDFGKTYLIDWWCNGVLFRVEPEPRGGYTCIGFSKTPDGALLSDRDAQAFADPAVFYARWSRNTYSITYNDNGGTFAGKTGSYNVDTNDFKLPTSGTRIGYAFAGWGVSGASGAGIAGNNTTNVTVKKGTYGNLTATAKWTPVSYPISWDTAGGSLTGQKTSYDIETPDYLLPTPTRTGYTFTGWEVSGASGVGIAGNGTTDVTVKKGTYGSLTAKAKWTKNTYHLIWNVPHGAHGNRTEDFTIDDCPIEVGPAIPDAGYSFTGWMGTGLSGATSAFSIDASFLLGRGDGASFSYTAGMEAASHVIFLHLNDEDNTIIEHAVTYDAPVAAVSVPKRYGYAFSGYYVKEPDGTKGERVFDRDGAYTEDSGIWKGLADLEVHAAWTLMGSLEVPVSEPGSISFTLDRATKEVEGTSGTPDVGGTLLSSMPEEVPLASVALEARIDDAGALVMERTVGKENLKRCAMKVLFASGEPSASVRFVSAESSDSAEAIYEFAPADAPSIPAAVPLSSALSGEDVVEDELGNLARRGRLDLSYALVLDAGFDPAKMPAEDVSEAVGRLVFTVDLTALERERF